MSKDRQRPEKPAAATSAKPANNAPAADAKRSGRVQFDDRGNAVWEWSVATGSFGRDVSTERLKRLENPGLSLADDSPTPFDYVKPNPLGTVKGYNPYDSGQLDSGKPTDSARKKDLRKLSEWLQLKKQAEGNKDE